MVDLIDKKLLIILGKNTRLSQNQLGRLVGVSRDVVQYRIKKLEDQQIIKQYICHIRNHFFGLETYYFSLKLQYSSKEREQEIVAALFKIPFLKLILQCKGDADLLLLVAAKNKLHLAQLSEQMSFLCGDNLKEQRLSLCVQVIKASGYDVLVPDFSYSCKSSPSDISYSVDKIDKKIARLLTRNARMPIVELAQHIKLTPQQASVRIKKLFATGVLSNTHAVVDVAKLGIQTYHVFIKLRNYTKSMRDKIKTYINTMPKLVYMQRLLGEWDFACTIMANDYMEFLGEVDLLREFFGAEMSYYSCSVVTKEAKRVSYLYP